MVCLEVPDNIKQQKIPIGIFYVIISESRLVAWVKWLIELTYSTQST